MVGPYRCLLKASGIVTYEQDWLDRIYHLFARLQQHLDTGEAFLDNMARACREQDITLQYCMPYPCYFLQGSRYENLTTIRTSEDRFNTEQMERLPLHLTAGLLTGHLAMGGRFYEHRDGQRLLSTLSAGRSDRRRHRCGKQDELVPRRSR